MCRYYTETMCSTALACCCAVNACCRSALSCCAVADGFCAVVCGCCALVGGCCATLGAVSCESTVLKPKPFTCPAMPITGCLLGLMVYWEAMSVISLSWPCSVINTQLLADIVLGIRVRLCLQLCCHIRCQTPSHKRRLEIAAPRQEPQGLDPTGLAPSRQTAETFTQSEKPAFELNTVKDFTPSCGNNQDQDLKHQRKITSRTLIMTTVLIQFQFASESKQHLAALLTIRNQFQHKLATSYCVSSSPPLKPPCRPMSWHHRA